MQTHHGTPSPARRAAALLAAAPILLTAACAAGPGATSPEGAADPSGAAPASDSSPASAEQTGPSGTPDASIPANETMTGLSNERGVAIGRLGEEMRFEDGDGKAVAGVTVERMRVVDSCPDGAAPENGHFLVLDLDAWHDDAAGSRPIRLAADQWSYYSPEGERSDAALDTDAARSCDIGDDFEGPDGEDFEDERIKDELGPDDDDEDGFLVLDVPAAEGSVVLTDLDEEAVDWPFPQ
ncbi:hypothetical protein ACQ7DA_10355 [Zafaria sp. J156]|uniref:hypothetical protein n=1 Tax=Zafaria sp. J156 TaxID=3116490 RepID=UPI002E763D64|nr:hypothetical protein [Zafaria sp. J156]MEE1621583.1 hypothetical protein [Zafaria sp. J156]